MGKYFITGIDTDIGKTFISIALCKSLIEKNYKTGYFKPLQSGAYKEKDVYCAPDIVELKKYLSIPAQYSYLLEGEVSPYLASKITDTKIDINKIKNDIDCFSTSLDFTIIEGAGGLYCPFCKNMVFADFIKELDIPTIIVATPHLGRLNHTLMSIECAKTKGINIEGIIINKMPAMPNLSESNFIDELKEFCSTPILSIIPEKSSIDTASKILKTVNL